jgi:hypothetical protein
MGQQMLMLESANMQAATVQAMAEGSRAMKMDDLRGDDGAQKETAIQMEQQLKSIQKREAFLQKKINAELARAQECSEKKDERGEMMALKTKELYEKVRDPRAFS